MFSHSKWIMNEAIGISNKEIAGLNKEFNLKNINLIIYVLRRG